MSKRDLPTSRSSQMTDEEAELILDSADPDLMLITEYLAGELTANRSRAVEKRLVSDAAFLVKAAPLLAFWRAPLGKHIAPYEDPKVRAQSLDAPSPRALDDSAKERAAAWARFCKAIGAVHVPWRDPAEDRESRSGARE